MTVNCSSSITVKEDHDLICLCKDENKNPPGDVIWYDKNGNAIGQKEKEQKTLVLRSVTKADGGAYTCKAKSYTLMDEKSIETKVSPNCKHYLCTRQALRYIYGCPIFKKVRKLRRSISRSRSYTHNTQTLLKNQSK